MINKILFFIYNIPHEIKHYIVVFMMNINSNSSPTTAYTTDIPNTRYIKCRVETPQFHPNGTKWFQQDGIVDTKLADNGLCNNVKSMLFSSNHWYGHSIHFQNIESVKRSIVRIYGSV